MKKIIISAIAALVSTVSFAQADNGEIIRIHKKDNTLSAFLIRQVSDITFEKVEKLEMTVDVEKATASEMVIDFQMPAKCKKWYLKISTEELTGTQAEIRKQIIEAHNNEYTEGQYLKFQNVNPSTDYYFYMLLFDEDDVPAGITTQKVTTPAA